MPRHLLGPNNKRVLSAVALGRLLQRHAYRHPKPEPGLDILPGPAGPTIRNLASTERADDMDAPVQRAFQTFDAPERRLQQGHIEIGAGGGTTITVDVTELSGVAFTGAVAHDVVRALLAGVLMGAAPGAAEVLMTAELMGRLFPGLEHSPVIRAAAGYADLARTVHAETIARARRLDASGALGASGFRSTNREDPLPVVMVVIDGLPNEFVARWAALLAGAPAVGIVVIVVGDSPLAIGSVAMNAARAVTAAAPDELAVRLAGARLFAMGADEAVDVLKAMVDSQGDEPADDWRDGIATVAAVGPLEKEATVLLEASRSGTSWPAPATPNETDRPLVVRVLGPYSVSAWDAPVSNGLRSRARALLAWYLLRPEGATADAAVDALWPTVPPGRVQRQFWRALGDLRSRLRGPGGKPLVVLEKVGERYRPAPGEISCDLWDFQVALTGVTRAVNEEAAAEALRGAIASYHGDLLEGSDYLWVEAARQDLHRRAVDAHLRLAELEDRGQRPDMAIAVLERAVDIDRYAEEPYRRLMAAYAEQGRPDAVAVTWQLLQSRLDELDLEMDTATVRLYHSLNADALAGDGRRATRVR